MIVIEVRHENTGEGGSFIAENIKRLLHTMGISCISSVGEGGELDCMNREKFLSRAKKDGYKVVVVDHDTRISI